MLSRRFRIGQSRRDETRGKAGQRLQRSCLRVVRDPVELSDRVRGFVQAALLYTGADHQLQRSRAFRSILDRQTTEVPLGEIRTGLEIPAIEYHRRASE